MSPELERLLEALFERDTCEPRDRPKWDSIVRRLVSDAIQKQPVLNHDLFLEALQARYRDFRRSRRKPSTLPPQA